MQYSVGVEYALHCLTYLTDLPPGDSVGIKALAQYQGVSETYLSKIFTKLSKAGVVRSLPGAKGGYQLARRPDAISFWDVVEATEGASPLFRCTEVRQHCILLHGQPLPDDITAAPCTIHTVMLEAEHAMRRELQDRSLAWLQETLNAKLPAERREATAHWFRQALDKQ